MVGAKSTSIQEPNGSRYLISSPIEGPASHSQSPSSWPAQHPSTRANRTREITPLPSKSPWLLQGKGVLPFLNDNHCRGQFRTPPSRDLSSHNYNIYRGISRILPERSSRHPEPKHSEHTETNQANIGTQLQTIIQHRSINTIIPLIPTTLS